MKIFSKKSTVNSIFPILFLLLFYLPIVVMFFLAFSSTTNISHFHFSIAGFNNLFGNAPFIQSIIVSVLVGFIASLIGVILAFLISISISNSRKSLRQTTISVMKIPLLNADVCNSLLVTFLFIGAAIKFGMFTFICAHIILVLPYAIFLIYPQTLVIKKEYLESAQDLGASWFFITRKIYFPLLVKNLFIAFFICFAISFDDFVFSFFNSGKYQNVSEIIYSLRTIKPFLYSFGAILFFFILLIYTMYLTKNKLIAFYCNLFKKIKISKNKIKNTYLLHSKLKKSLKRNNTRPIPSINYLKYARFFKLKLVPENNPIVHSSNNTTSLIQQISKFKYYIFFILMILLACIITIYLVILNSNSLSVFIFNSYIKGSSVESFIKTAKTNVSVIEYDTNENFFSKTKYVNFDVGMVSDYGVQYEGGNLKKLTSQDKQIFVKYYNYYSHTNYESYSDIFSKYSVNRMLWQRFSKVNYDKKYNLLDYTIPYVVNDLRFLVKKTDSTNINPYKKMYQDSLNNKKVVIFNDPRDLFYFGIKVAESFQDPNLKLSGQQQFFSTNNINIAMSYLKAMLLHKNTILEGDTVLPWLEDTSVSDIYTNGYDLASWFNENHYANVDKYQMIDPNGDWNNNYHDKDFTTNLWEDGFVIKKGLSKKKTNNSIKFIAYQFSNQIALHNSNYFSLFIPTNYITESVMNNKKYLLPNNKHNLNFLIPSLNYYDNSYQDYFIFDDCNEKSIRLLYTQLYNNQ